MRNKTITYLFAGALMGLPVSAYNQSQECVYQQADIYPGSYGSAPNNMTWYNGALYFGCTGNGQGLELWKFENNVSSMVLDINPGFSGSLLNQFTVVGPYLYFTATNGVTGIELYRYDGSTATLCADINPGIAGSNPDKLMAIGTDLYFFANDGVNGVEPWVFDGTTATMIADICPGSCGCAPSDNAEYAGDYFFTATESTAGLELYKYDGATVTLFDLYPGPSGSDVNELVSIGTKLCFRATDGVNGYELWTYDGVSVTNLNVHPTSDFTPWELTEMNGVLYCRGVSPTAGYELFQYDGTTASLVFNIRPGAANSAPNNLTPANGTLYFAANNGTTGNELWYWDGTTCAQAADIYAGGTGSMPVFFIERMASYGDDVYLVAQTATSNYEVWHYDGTNCILGKDIGPGALTSNPTGLKAYGTKLYWCADDWVTGSELWVWDLDADLDDTLAVVTCGNYTSPDGDLYTIEGTYQFTDTLPSVNCPGCDSLIFVDLAIVQPDDSISVFACNDYTSPSGTFYDTEGTYTIVDVIPSIACPGVDSTITIDLTIVDDISTAVVVFSGVLVAQQSGAAYQWLDCDNGYAPVPGATDQDFLPSVTGTYACEVTLGLCADTTNCNFVEVDSGIGFESSALSNMAFYPNPVSGVLTVQTPGISKAWLSVTNQVGQVMVSALSENDTTMLDLSMLAPGVYFLTVRTESAGLIVHKICKN
jgi:ELWxxDGT repeat protein